MDAIDSNGIAFVVGARVVSTGFVDRYPDFMLPPGVTGTVTDMEESGDGTIRILVDLPWRHLITDPEHEHRVDCYGGTIRTEDGRDLTAGEVAALEWIVTSLPNGADLKPRPSITSVAVALVNYFIDNGEPGVTDRARMEALARHGVGPNGWNEVGRARLTEARYPQSALAALDTEVRRIAAERRAAMPREWKVSVSVLVRVSKDLTVQANTEDLAKSRAHRLVGDWIEEGEVIIPDECDGTRIACTTHAITVEDIAEVK